jgi:hypothetical protein
MSAAQQQQSNSRATTEQQQSNSRAAAEQQQSTMLTTLSKGST